MSNFKYDFIVVGRWRNREQVDEVRNTLRAAGKTVYCFTDNEYDSDGIKIETQAGVDTEQMMSGLESTADWRTNPTFRKIFETDMSGLRDAEKLVVVFPAGASAHMELGVAHGMGKPCYAVGQPDKPETLYLMLNQIFPDAKTLAENIA